MAVVIKEEKNSYAYLDDEEDALLNEAICCSRNLEIKTDDEDDNDTLRKDANIKQKSNEKHKKQKSNIPWYDMDSDTTTSDLSISNGRIDLSTSSEKIDLSNGKLENDNLLKDHANSKIVETVETKEIQHKDYIKEIEHIMDTNNAENISPVRKRIREVEDNDEELKISRNRRNSTSSSSTVSNNSKRSLEYETDRTILARRQKDIDYGKNTIGYDRYTKEIPKDKRTKDHPRTPPMHTKYSRRGWDGMVKLWRKQLHFWDPKEKLDENKS